MPKKSDDEWLPDARGRYRRKVGWWNNEAGQRKQYPFTFGKNKDQAKARLARVRELWAEVEKQHAEPKKQVGFPPMLAVPNEDKAAAIWANDTLYIAMNLAAGNVQISIGAIPGLNDYVYAQRLQELAKKFPFIRFVADEPDRYENGATFLSDAANHQLAELERRYPEATEPYTRVGSEKNSTLHAALDAYVEFVKKRDVDPSPDGPVLKAYGAQKIANTVVLKRHHKDRTLDLDLDTCQDLVDYWRNRPLTTDDRIKPSRPMASRYCENHIAELMRFFRWLHKSKIFPWRKPEDFEDLELQVKSLPEERTSIVDFTTRSCYLPSELPTLNKHATPLERLLLLLGLNCGFKGAEQGTLLLDHLFLDGPHPNERYLLEVAQFKPDPNDKFVLYKRNKSQVYGEFLLWPQTVQMINWAIDQRNRIVEELCLDYRHLLITNKGTLYYRMTDGGKNRSQIFNNKWRALIKRIKKSEPGFPEFPFSSLRDTASDLVRQVADGEVAATFLMHGKPVKQDDLLDLYTKRPFVRVFNALRALQSELKPFFEAAPDDVVEQPMQQYTPLNKRERIVELKKAGNNVTQIMEEVGVSRMTVLRTLEKLYFRKKR